MEASSHNPNFKPLSPESLTCIEQRRVEKEQQGKCSKTALNAMVVATTSTTANEAVQEEELLAVKDPDLQDGRVLPPSLGPFPEKLTGQPLEDFDPYYQREMTFCVVSKHFSGRRHIHRMSASRSLYIFSPFNKLRRIAVYIAVHRFFDIAVMLTIVVNCVFLALTTPIELSEWVFTGIYTLEMVVKIIARGFILTKFTYLRDPWNWLDFLVVCLAFVTFSLSDLGNLTGIRTFRVLRALKTISIVPGLKTIVNALLKSMKMLGEVMLLIVFCLTVFALFALQVYLGVLRHKCVQNLPENMNVTDIQYAEHIQNSTYWYGSDGEYIVCGNASEAAKCPDGYTCLPDIGINPNFGYTGFDDFGMALLTSLQLITLDYWENVYNLIIEASGPWNMLFFIIVVFFGSFYLINLMLAVVAISYEEEANYSKQFWKKLRRKVRSRQWVSRMAKDGAPAQQTGTASEFTLESGDQTKQNPPPNDAGDSGEIETEKPRTSTNDTPMGSKEYPTAVMKLEEGKTVYVPDGDIQEEKGKGEDSNKLGKVDGKISSSAVEVEPKVEDGPFNKLSVIEEKVPRSSSPTIRVTEPSPVLYTEPSRFDRLKKGFMDRCCAWTCCPCWGKFQGVMHVIAMDPLFELFITLCIIVNTAFLTIDHHGMSEDLQNTLTVGNLVFTGIFGAEALMKMIALGKNYFKDRWNVFDFVVVMVSLLELALVNVKGLSVLRTFRLLRVFKLARSWPTMKMLLSIIGSSLGALANLTVVLVIIVYILAVLGMQLFGEQYRTFYAGNMPRYTFVDFFHSFMMIFRVLCGEWIEPLWECMQAAGSGCIPMFLVTLTLGNFMVLNLFLALLLNSFGADTLSNHEQNQTGNSNKIMAGLNRLRAVLAFKRQKSPKVRPRQDGKEESNSNAESEGGGKLAVISNGSGPSIEMHAMEEGRNKSPNNIKSITSLSTNQDPPSKKSSPRRLAPLDSRALVDEPPITPTQVVQHTERAFQAQREAFSRFEETMYQNHGSSVALDSPRSVSHAGSRAPSPGARSTSNSPRPKSANSQVSSALVASPKEDNEDKEQEMDEEGKPKVTFEETDKEPEDCFPECCIQNCCMRCSCYSRFTTSKHSDLWAAVRKFNFKIVNHKVFEGFILLIIMGSSLCLIFEDIYLPTKPQLKAVLYYLDITFVVIFTVEMILKWLGVGFKRYFGSVWCWLDFVIVVISLVSIGAATAGIDNLSAFRALRTLRALRPLRAISRWEGMRVVVNALLQAIPSIFNVLLVCLVFWLICSIMAVQFFGGQFYKCLDENGEKLDITIVNNRTECLDKNYTWVNSKVNFDHVGQAYLALLQVATFEGWIEVMSDAVDVRGVDMQPSFEYTFYAYSYFVFFIIFGSFFTLNLFIGVIIDTFNVLKKKYDGEASIDLFLTETQRKYYNAMRKLGSKKPQKTINRPKNKCQAALFDFVSSKGFEIGIVILIMLNMVAMAVEHYKQSDTVTYVLALVNIVFTSIFTVEAVLKIIAYRWHYFRVAWNVFDFIVVLLSILGLILDDLLQNVFITPTLLRVVRVFRIGRVLRLVRAAKGIRKLLFALMTSLPALFNIGLLLFLVMFIFAVFGMTSFAYVKKEGALNDMVNFETFGRSLILLFRLTTSAGWNDVLEPLMNENPPDCDPNFPNGYWKGNCSVAWLAVAYFVSYIILSFLIVINMYIAVILENFNQAHQQEEDGITEDDFEMFYSVWERYDPYATQFIYYHQLSDFCDNLDEPLRIPKPNTIKIASLNLPVRAGDRIHCIDVLESLTRRVLGEVEDSEEFSELKAQMQRKFQEAFPQLTRHEARTTTFMKKQEDRAARVIQRAYRQWVLRKSIRGASQMWRLRNSNSSLNTADQSPAKLPLTPSRDTVNTKSPFLGVRQRWALDQKTAKRTSFASQSDQHAPDNDSVERKLSTHSLGQPDPTT
ncbi:sodium channel protein type 4 subunit alpha B-like isoform X2 [Branchiostoma floridae x Branchiostoma japonicum]